MSEEKRHQEHEEMLGSIFADGAELWQLADEFVQSLPVHLNLMQEALRKMSAEFLGQTSSKLRSARPASRARMIFAARAGDAAEECVVGGLAARMDDLTATILQLSKALT